MIFFILVAVLLLLNLLIAVMSEAYEEVKEVAEARWAYVQMEMLLEYDAGQAANAKSSGSGGGGCCGRCRGGENTGKLSNEDAGDAKTSSKKLGKVGGGAVCVRVCVLYVQGDKFIFPF